MISVEKEIFKFKNTFQKKYQLEKLLQDKKLFNCYPIINIVGTNGKGSTSKYLSYGFQRKFAKVGLFISPAFLYHNERIQINNVPISDDDLKRLIKESKKEIENYQLTFFEIWTLLAIKYFAKNKIDFAVIEAGIGGRLDSTKVFKNQTVIAVTSIGLDHEEILGDTEEKIIYQKIGIANGAKKFYLAQDNEKYLNFFTNFLPNSEIVLCDLADEVKGYQKINLGLAKTILRDFDIDTTGLEMVEPPLGRFSILKDNPYLILDGCHNLDGIKKMIASASEIKKRFTILFATSSGRNAKQMVSLLQKNFDEVFICDFNHFKAWTIPGELDYIKVDNWKKFMLENNDKNLIVCGSLYFIPLVYEFIKE